MLEPHVAGIDVNMGCPKEFSIKGGMGAALLTQPHKIRSILTTLVKGLSVPVTCKIRILPDLSDTLALCKLIENCGVAALAVHGRLKEERPQHPNHDDVISEIAKVLTIPVIANGGSKEINNFSDIKDFCDRTNSCSVMIARAVMWNCSILRKEGFLPLDDVIRQFLRYAILYDNPFTYTKYAVQNMLRDLQESPRGKAFLETQTVREIANIWGLAGEYDEALQKRQNDGSLDRDLKDQRRWAFLNRDEMEIVKNEKNGQTISVQMPMQFIRGNFCNADLPKMVLNKHVGQNSLPNPVFGVHTNDRYFVGYMDLNDVRYETTCIEKSRRYAEQAAAMVYLHSEKLVDSRYGFTAAEGARKYQHLSHFVEKTPRAQRQQDQAAKLHIGRNRRRQGGTSALEENKKQENEHGKRMRHDDASDEDKKVLKCITEEVSANKCSKITEEVSANKCSKITEVSANKCPKITEVSANKCPKITEVSANKCSKNDPPECSSR